MSSVITWSTVLILLVWLAALAPLRLRRSGHRSNVKGSRGGRLPWWDLSTALLPLSSALSLQAEATALPPGPLGPLLQPLGLLVTIVSAVFILRASVALGDSFAPGLEVWNEQEMVAEGLYSLVRHPIYLGTITLWMGAGMALLSWLVLFLGVALIAPTLYLMARREEQLLANRFGRAYGEYQERVPMLLPGRLLSTIRPSRISRR